MEYRCWKSTHTQSSHSLYVTATPLKRNRRQERHKLKGKKPHPSLLFGVKQWGNGETDETAVEGVNNGG